MITPHSESGVYLWSVTLELVEGTLVTLNLIVPTRYFQLVVFCKGE